MTRKGAPAKLGLAAAACALMLAGLAHAAAVDPRLTRAEIEDALAPWSLESTFETPAPAALPDTSGGAAASAGAGPSQLSAAPEAPEEAGAGGGERVLVLRCRQLVIGTPSQAARLAKLLRSGSTLEAARRVIDGLDVVERTREYAVDDLEPGIRSELENLPEGGWSQLRTWRGRSVLVQVVSKKEKERRSIPKLGAGLDAEEQGRVARALQRAARAAAPPPPTSVPGAQVPGAAGANRGQPPPGEQPPQRPEPGVTPATMVDRKDPEYPQDVAQSGRVTLRVYVGSLDDFEKAEVVETTDPVFVDPAMQAAKLSTYRAQTRNGMPERATLTVNYEFRAPQPQQQPD